jgi:hypothetical protein
VSSNAPECGPGRSYANGSDEFSPVDAHALILSDRTTTVVTSSPFMMDGLVDNDHDSDDRANLDQVQLHFSIEALVIQALASLQSHMVPHLY